MLVVTQHDCAAFRNLRTRGGRAIRFVSSLFGSYGTVTVIAVFAVAWVMVSIAVTV
jgi:hypothetical protein